MLLAMGQLGYIKTMTILDEDVQNFDKVFNNGGIVLPHKMLITCIFKLTLLLLRNLQPRQGFMYDPILNPMKPLGVVTLSTI
jgi:hypothetical protein